MQLFLSFPIRVSRHILPPSSCVYGRHRMMTALFSLAPAHKKLKITPGRKEKKQEEGCIQPVSFNVKRRKRKKKTLEQKKRKHTAGENEQSKRRGREMIFFDFWVSVHYLCPQSD